MDATISVICYKSKTLANGEHPLMLRIAQNGKAPTKALKYLLQQNIGTLNEMYPNLTILTKI